MVKELERRQKLRKTVYSWPALVLVALVAIFLVKGAWGILSIERDSASKVEDLESQNAALVIREQSLKDEIERLQTDEGKVEAIKAKFSAVREGEFVAVIVDERRKATSTEDKPKAWWEKWWSAIIH